MKVELVNGAVFKDGEEIGKYNAETNTVHCPQRISPALYGPIKEAIGQKPNYDFGAPNPPASHTSPPAAPPSASEQPPVPKELATAPVETPAKAAAAAKPSVHPEPPQDPQFGDKTPAWAKWLRDTNPEEFERRFAGRKLTLD